MKTTEILSELISYIEQYSESKKQEDLSTNDFAIWLNSRLYNDDVAENKETTSHDINLELVFSLLLLSKHFKSSIREVLSDSIISTPDSYSFLLHLSYTESMRKMELVKIHLLEAPSGIEIIKRLLKKNLIEEFDDPKDKRAKRLKITEKGVNEIKSLEPKMNELYKDLV
ncbi:MAG: hypothetical protein C0596_13810 [Marinilabiliales bacterium]|nr:MAG: hypothetical protein C0596_13810 [Marinilabiliales bacterium]